MRGLDIMTGIGTAANRAWVDAPLDLARAITDPLESGGLAVAYQPQVDLVTGQLVGVEALARWNHPVRGSVAPKAFIPVAERAGLIHGLGRWVLRRAVEDLAAWERVAPQAAALRLGVNIACCQLRPGLAADVQQICSDASIDPARLTLEITETMRLDLEQACDALQALRALGVQLALDDFGTGYATLGHLHQIAVDQLKLDRSFVAAPHGPACDAVVQAVCMLADALSLELVAEGVETPAEHHRLLDFGCRTAQGFLYARPMPPAQLLDLLAARDVIPAPVGTRVAEWAS